MKKLMLNSLDNSSFVVNCRSFTPQVYGHLASYVGHSSHQLRLASQFYFGFTSKVLIQALMAPRPAIHIFVVATALTFTVDALRFFFFLFLFLVFFLFGLNSKVRFQAVEAASPAFSVS